MLSDYPKLYGGVRLEYSCYNAPMNVHSPHAWFRIFPSRQELYDLYIVKGLSEERIAKLKGCSSKPVETAIAKYRIPRQTNRRAPAVGPQNPSWKGSRAGVLAMHLRVYRVRGRAADGKCSMCDTAQAKDWANLTGDFENVYDYIRACRKCHKYLDRRSHFGPRNG